MSYPIPNTLVFLGVAVEADLIHMPQGETDCDKIQTYQFFNTHLKGGMNVLADGWIMACSPKAFDAKNPSLYLLRPKSVRIDFDAPQAHHKTPMEAFFLWTQRDPDKTLMINQPPPANKYYGYITSINYLSDKWNDGDIVEYIHDFWENDGQPPSIFFDKQYPELSRTAEIVGGTMRLSEDGII